MENKKTFQHKSLELEPSKNVVFIAMSKYFFYLKDYAIKYVLERGYVPISPYGIFGYFLMGVVNEDIIREANNTLIKKCDELWVFGTVSDGVLAEIKLSKKWGKPIRYFAFLENRGVREISAEDVELENNIIEFKHEL